MCWWEDPTWGGLPCGLTLPYLCLQVVIETGIASLVTIATILWGTPTFIFPLIIIACLQVYISNGYVSFSRDMRRIESNTRSPIIASFSELVRACVPCQVQCSLSLSFLAPQINGISTVRAFGTERFFVDKTYKRLDRVQAAGYYCTKFPPIGSWERVGSNYFQRLDGQSFPTISP